MDGLLTCSAVFLVARSLFPTFVCLYYFEGGGFFNFSVCACSAGLLAGLSGFTFRTEATKWDSVYLNQETEISARFAAGSLCAATEASRRWVNVPCVCMREREMGM